MLKQLNWSGYGYVLSKAPVKLRKNHKKLKLLLLIINISTNLKEKKKKNETKILSQEGIRRIFPKLGTNVFLDLRMN